MNGWWTRVVLSVLKHGPGSSIVVARIRSFCFVFVGKPIPRSIFCVWGEVLIGPLVTALKPEAGRSIPGQDEVALTSDGGPNGCCSAKHSFDLGIVVKGQSRPATAGSTRNDSKVSLTGDWWRGRALIERLGRETSRRSVKLRTRYRC